MATTTKVNKYKYHIDTLSIICDNTLIEIADDRVEYIIVDRNFDGINLLPKFTIGVSMDKADYYTFISKYNEAIVTCNINKIRIRDDENIEVEKKYLRLSGQCLPSDMSPNIYKDIDENSDNANIDIDNNKQLVKCRLSLFDTEALSKFKTLVGGIYTGTPSTILTYAFNKAGFNVLMTPFDNSESRQSIIPEMTIVELVEYLYRYRGYYNTGHRMFYDIDKVLYFLDNSGECKSYRNNETKNIYIDVMQKSVESVYGGYIDNKSYVIVTPIDDMTLRSNAVAASEAKYTKIKTVSHNDNIRETSIDNITKFNSGERTTVMENKYDNEFLINSLSHKVSQNQNIINVTVSQIDLSMITPNKKYTIRFPDNTEMTSLSGTYKLGRVITKLTTQGVYLNAASVLKMIRV